MLIFFFLLCPDNH